jgi:hypothetical protein
MMNDKKLDKLERTLGKDTIADLNAVPVDMLKAHIVASEQSMKAAKEELEANPQYQELRENLKALSQGLREVNTRQRAIIQYCLHLIEEKGSPRD